MQRRTLIKAGALAAAPGLWSAAHAQESFPNKPITIVVAFTAGGSADQRARQIGKFMSADLGQSVIVENRPGAGGNIGTQAIARSRPDGYTLGIGNMAPMG